METATEVKHDDTNSALVNASTSLEPSAPVPPECSSGASAAGGKFACWNKCWFAAVVILSWALLIGFLALVIFCGIRWSNSSKDYDTAKSESVQMELELARESAAMKALEKQRDERKGEVAAERGAVEKLKIQLGDKTKEFEELGKEEVKLKSEIETAVKNRDHYKDENAKITEKNTELQNTVNQLTKEVEEMRHEIIQHGNESYIYRLSSWGAGGAFLAGVIDTAITYYNLYSVESQIQAISHYVASFETLSRGYEAYEVLSAAHHKTVVRTKCFSGTNKGDLANCVDKGPTITTIRTNDGYQFGAVLFKNWGTIIKSYADNKAFTFSYNLAAMSQINDPAHAMIVDPAALLQFGEGDIKVDYDGVAGSTAPKTYTVPAPYTNSTFYHNGDSFQVQSISIDTVAVHQG